MNFVCLLDGCREEIFLETKKKNKTKRKMTKQDSVNLPQFGQQTTEFQQCNRNYIHQLRVDFSLRIFSEKEPKKKFKFFYVFRW